MSAAGSIGIALLFLVLVVLIGSWLIQVSVNIVAKFKPSIGTCFVVMVVTAVANAAVGAGIGAVLSPDIGGIVSFPVGFFVASALLGVMVKDPDGEQLGFVKGMLAILVQYLIMIVVCCIPAFGIGIFAGLGSGAFGF